MTTEPFPPETLSEMVAALHNAAEHLAGRLDALEQDSDATKAEVTATLGQVVERLEAHDAVFKAGTWANDCPEDFPDWVAWLARTYYLRTLDLENSAIVEELKALRAAHRVAFGPQSKPWDQVTWHNHLAQVTARFETHRSNAQQATSTGSLLPPGGSLLPGHHEPA